MAAGAVRAVVGAVAAGAAVASRPARARAVTAAVRLGMRDTEGVIVGAPDSVRGWGRNVRDAPRWLCRGALELWCVTGLLIVRC
ncbi:hypothetical protein GCM10010249_07660 [Streptomyces roseolilacinus]|uniref:Uncharacterized protein n=1 Tax=Streptomyces roseolilacinus TaxID=66904 RepID=A0A918AVX6_9ACTN|nr:hypothetical protein GCM10010249_07660 [Streptomyces roseolilacinus]